jgi:hypothetical protein
MKKIEKMLVNAILDAIDNSEGKFVVDAEDDVLVEIEGSYEPYGAMFLNKRWVTDSASVKIERVTAYDGDIEIEADMDVELIEAELIEAEVERNL